jgi:signal-transduction protein with cAMP-binding, CBS, and nucleotidyltransferase domain
MICPTCGWDNLPGNEECVNCQQDLTPLDRPMAQNCVERSLMEDEVKGLRPRKAITCRPQMPIQAAIQAMLASDIGTLLVTDDDGKLLGIFSERDLLTKLMGVHQNYTHLCVGDFMTPNPETVGIHDTLNFALHKMDGGGYRHLPVVDQGKPLGVVSVRDMLRHIVRLCKT